MMTADSGRFRNHILPAEPVPVAPRSREFDPPRADNAQIFTAPCAHPLSRQFLFSRRPSFRNYSCAVKLELNSSPPYCPRWEPAGAIFITTLFLLINFLVATRTPTVYVDEPQYCDPAANLFLGDGFTSTMWGQGRGDFWCGNVPLYQ